MAAEVSRRDFLSRLGVTVGAAATAASVPLVGAPALIERAHAQPKGNIPDTPYKVGHMTFFTGAAAVLGEPSYKGHILAAEEINAQGGLLGKRKIETGSPKWLFKLPAVLPTDSSAASTSAVMSLVVVFPALPVTPTTCPPHRHRAQAASR